MTTIYESHRVTSQVRSFLCQHLQRYGGAGRGVSSYLSKTVCEELIVLMGKKVEEIIIQRIKEAKYYSIQC